MVTCLQMINLTIDLTQVERYCIGGCYCYFSLSGLGFINGPAIIIADGFFVFYDMGFVCLFNVSYLFYFILFCNFRCCAAHWVVT